MISEFSKRVLSTIILLPISLLLIYKGGYYFNFFISVILIISLLEWLKFNLELYIKISGSIFLLFSFYCIYEIRNYPTFGIYFFLFILTICVSTDIGGYCFGKILKGPKLTIISPNKTYSGMVGSFLLSILFTLLYLKFLRNYYILNINYDFNYLLIIFLISLISQLGDILISYFKRKSKLKDTGNLIPGHGGVLDRIDGMIFVFPVIYLIKFFI